MNDQRNLMIAIVASLAILLVWETLVVGPRTAREHQARLAAAKQQEAAQSTGAPVAGLSGGVGVAGETPALQPLSRQAALAASPRIAVNSPRVDGSISLQGARFDDLRLKDYRQTVDPKSPEIALLAPRGTAQAYYADFGWAATGTVNVPGPATMWQAEDQRPLTPDHPVTLTWNNGAGLVFIRKIALDDDYMFTVTDRIENTGTAPAALAAFGRIARHGVAHHQSYWILHEGLLGVFNGALETARYKDLAKDAEPDKTIEHKGDEPGGWLGITDKYWMAVLIPDQSQTMTGHFIDRKVNGEDVYQADFLGPTKTLAPGASLETTHHLFAGAKQVGVIDHYAKTLGIAHFDLAIDWGWFYFLTRPIFRLLDFYNGLVGNFGVAILLLTVTIKAALFPLANRSYAAMSKMKKLQPEMERLRERYKEDKAKQQQELLELYKKEKVNPVAGCLPVVFQIPIFFSLYKVLFVTIEMRHAPFFGWIRDLSAPDPTTIFNLFGLIPWTPPVFLHILGVWPIIMGLTMFLQTKMNPTPQDPVQAKIFLFMPVIFTLMMGSFPAGLVIYWTWNNTLSVTQQYVIMRRMGVDPEFGSKFPRLAKWGRSLKNKLGGGRGNGSSRQPGE